MTPIRPTFAEIEAAYQALQDARADVTGAARNYVLTGMGAAFLESLRQALDAEAKAKATWRALSDADRLAAESVRLDGDR